MGAVGRYICGPEKRGRKRERDTGMVSREIQGPCTERVRMH